MSKTLETAVGSELSALEALASAINSVHSGFTSIGIVVTQADVPMFAQWASRALSLVRRFEDTEAFADPIEKSRQAAIYGSIPFFVWDRFQAALGALAGFKAAFEAGLISDVRLAIKRETHADFLEQAELLLREEKPVPDSLKTAATVLAGAVLEDSLRSLVTKHAVPPPAKPSLSTLNQALRDAKVYDKVEWGLVDAWGRLRNGAAHGEHATVPVDQVQPMIDGVRGFIARHLR